MALVFQRSARNYVKNGYFPTDDETMRRVAMALTLGEPAADGHRESGLIRLFDPCCGEGRALARLEFALRDMGDYEGPWTHTYGVELNKDRAWQAKHLLNAAIHSSIHDVVVKSRSMSLLFLNPPYGYGLRDDVNATEDFDLADKAERFERTFLKKTAPSLVEGGVLVYVIPYTALDPEIRTYLARNFEDLRFFMAPVQTYRQCVIFGRKTRAHHPRKDVLDMLASGQAGEMVDQVLPLTWDDDPYLIPLGGDEREFDFHAVRLDAPQLDAELERMKGSLLWSHFGEMFNQNSTEQRRPLREMSKWHLALALAAGQVTGLIRAENGRSLLIKGDTFKSKVRSVQTAVDEDGNVSETITLLDRFVPVINAIEFTPGPRLGQIVKIS